MKRTIIAALCCTTLAGQLPAQTEVLESNGEISVIPGSLTASGKHQIITMENTSEGMTSVKIYDENLKEILSKSFNLGSYTNKRWTEVATVVPTGAKLDPDQKPNIYLHDADEMIDLTSVKTARSLADALNRYYGLPHEYDSDYYFTGFTDIEGYICCCINNSAYYHEDWLGKQYPQTYIRLKEGHIYQVSNIPYTAVYNTDTAVWEIVETMYENNYTTQLYDFEYQDYDNKEYAKRVFASQTLFNGNDTWEFIVPVYQQKIQYGKPWESGIDSNGIRLKRDVYTNSETIEYKVIDENGSDVPGLTFKGAYDVWRMNGKSYICGYYYTPDRTTVEILYTLDGDGNAVESIRTAGKRKMTKVIGNAIDVNTYNESGNVLLTDMAGSTIGQKATDGTSPVRFSSDNLPKGIYNVTLQRNGRTINNEKVLVK